MGKLKPAKTDRREMTTGERQEFAKLLRYRAKIAKDAADERGAWMLADAEAKLAAVYKVDDEAWASATVKVEKAIDDLNALVAQISRERGVPEDFYPRANMWWWERGENGSAKRRAELRRVAEARVDAEVLSYKVQIDLDTERQLTQLLAGGLESEEAKSFLANMPDVTSLLPPISTLELDSGEIVMLEDRQNVTTDRNGVTVDRNGVTAKSATVADVQDYLACSNCGKALPSGRGKYCSNACRQAGHRRRHAAPTGP